MIDGAPDPVAPFSHAVEADGWVFVTGQMPFEGLANDSAYPEGIEAQTHQVMKNLSTVLEGVGLGCDKGLPEAKVFSKNVEERITEFLSDPSSAELAFNPDLSKADRALVHTLAQKHNLKHQSSGKGDERFITVYKRTHVPSAEAARMNEHAVEEQVQLR
jgi:enamine deaminase RidA (YjgF/YER057c/UK114 family)